MTTKYRPTVIIGTDELIALGEGTLTLQCGQWIQLAYSNTKSRWVGLTRAGSLWAVHKDGGPRHGKHDAGHFAELARSYRTAR
jgi:hypothetical protein